MNAIRQYHDPEFSLQEPFDVAVVTATILRPSLKDALLSVFRQSFRGRVQILVGIDKPIGDPAVLSETLAHRPPHHAVTVLDLGYSTSVRHGGPHPDMWGGATVTMLSYLANSRYVAYLGDDNWMGETHLETLRAAVQNYDWAFSLRWFVEETERRPLCVDGVESVGPGRGVFAKAFGGWVDPNCLLIDKIACEPVLRYRSFPFVTSTGDNTAPSDRGVFDQLRRYRWVCTNQATSYYTMQASDVNHASRMSWITAKLAAQTSAARS